MSRKEELLERSCPHSSEDRGGVHTNFDGYSDRPKVGLPEYDWRFICWECWEEWGSELSQISKKEIEEAFNEAGLCGFTKAYIGRCREPVPCEEHADETCWKCEEPATSQCSVAGTLVCGMPQCDDHPHAPTHQREVKV